MARIHKIDGSTVYASPKQGAFLWSILNGEREPTEKESKIVNQIKNLYLNWREAPDSYIEANKKYIFPLARADWMMDTRGKPARPDPTDLQAIEFTRKWGNTNIKLS